MTDKKKARQTVTGSTLIRNFEEWSRIALDSANDIIGICDMEGRVFYISPSCRKVLGWPPEELVNRYGSEIAHPDDLGKIYESAGKISKDKEIIYQWRAMTSSGKYVWLEQSFRALTNKDNEIEFIVFVARNIDERKELEQQLTSTAEELSESNQMKDKLITLVAHDLQNPIYSIITLSNFIKSKLDTISKQELLDFISQINDTAQNSFILLENLILLDKVNRKDVSLNPEKIKVHKLVADNLNLLKNQISHKDLDVTTQIPDDLYLNADFYIFDTVIKNILSNAVKYTHPKGQIFVSAARDNGNVIVTIRDTGIGMSKEQQKYIFNVDTRKRLNSLSTAHGSGLGLIICNELIAQQGGSIAIESNFRKGSKFTITFPQSIRKNPE